MLRHAVWIPIAALCGSMGCSGPPAGAPAADTAATLDGARLFDGNCVACHQSDAQGVPGVYPSLKGSPVLDGDPKALARWVIRGERPASLPAGRYATVMPQFGWMKPAAAAALFTYLRSHFGNSAPPVDAPAVTGALAP